MNQSFRAKCDSIVRGLLSIILMLLLLSACAEKAKPLRIGDKAPQFVTQDISGKPVSLPDYAGHPVVLRFWSTECKFCRADTPIFNRYFETYKEKGLKVVYINTAQTEEEIKAFVEDLDIVFPVVRDTQGKIAKSYNIKVQPMTIILSPEHRLLAAIMGGVSEAELKELIGRYLDTSNK